MRAQPRHRGSIVVIALAMVLISPLAAVACAPLISATTGSDEDAEVAAAALADDAARGSSQELLLDPSICDPIRPGSPPAATPVVAASAVEEIDPDLWDFSEGIQAENATFMEPVLVAQEFLACSNAGNAPAALTMVIDSSRWTPGETPVAASPAALAVPAAPRLALIDVPDVREHETGHVAVFFEIGDPAYCEWNVMLAIVFQKVGEVWLIDAIADVTDGAPIDYRPPVFRSSDAPTCRSGG